MLAGLCGLLAGLCGLTCGLCRRFKGYDALPGGVGLGRRCNDLAAAVDDVDELTNFGSGREGILVQGCAFHSEDEIGGGELFIIGRRRRFIGWGRPFVQDDFTDDLSCGGGHLLRDGDRDGGAGQRSCVGETIPIWFRPSYFGDSPGGQADDAVRAVEVENENSRRGIVLTDGDNQWHAAWRQIQVIGSCYHG